MGETDDELVDVVFALRELDPDSVPVNFLIPFEGTPLGGQWALTPQRCLRILAMVRFTCPDAEVRLAGGREIHLRSLQPLALHIVNSIFLGDYLTSEGQAGARDLEMIADAGFTVEGAAERTLPEHRRDLVRVRRRGPGTSLPGECLTRGSRTSSAPPRCTGRRRRPSRWGSGGSARRPVSPAAPTRPCRSATRACRCPRRWRPSRTGTAAGTCGR